MTEMIMTRITTGQEDDWDEGGTGMTGMTGIARMSRMTRLLGSSFSRNFKDTFPIFQGFQSEP